MVGNYSFADLRCLWLVIVVVVVARHDNLFTFNLILFITSGVALHNLYTITLLIRLLRLISKFRWCSDFQTLNPLFLSTLSNLFYLVFTSEILSRRIIDSDKLSELSELLPGKEFKLGLNHSDFLITFVNNFLAIDKRDAHYGTIVLTSILNHPLPDFKAVAVAVTAVLINIINVAVIDDFGSMTMLIFQ